MMEPKSIGISNETLRKAHDPLGLLSDSIRGFYQACGKYPRTIIMSRVSLTWLEETVNVTAKTQSFDSAPPFMGIPIVTKNMIDIRATAQPICKACGRLGVECVCDSTPKRLRALAVLSAGYGTCHFDEETSECEYESYAHVNIELLNAEYFKRFDENTLNTYFDLGFNFDDHLVAVYADDSFHVTTL